MPNGRGRSVGGSASSSSVAGAEFEWSVCGAEFGLESHKRMIKYCVLSEGAEVVEGRQSPPTQVRFALPLRRSVEDHVNRLKTLLARAGGKCSCAVIVMDSGAYLRLFAGLPKFSCEGSARLQLLERPASLRLISR